MRGYLLNVVFHAHANFQADAFGSFVMKYGLAVTDKRPQGGSLWVHTGQSNTDVANQLRAWGFAFSETREGGGRGRTDGWRRSRPAAQPSPGQA